MDGMVHSANLWASYIWPAYILTVGGLVALLGWSFTAMLRSEKRSDEMKRR
jgi:hypothetical protein